MKIFTRLILCTLTACIGCLGMKADDSKPKYNPVILQLEEGQEISDLEAQGIVVWHHRGDMALALLPIDYGTGAQRRVKGVRRIDRQRFITTSMDSARLAFDAYKIGTGDGLSQAYDGSGVVVGFCDTGFEPNHVAFLGADGKSRVKKLVAYEEAQGERTILTDPDEIASWTTDNEDDYHGTHVANIMTGSYKPNDLYGMAPGADIVAATSQLYDMGILSACEEIIAYAKSVNKPAVINLSLSTYNGPHDGSSLFNRYLDLLGEEAIICMASGNAGANRAAYSMNFTDSNRQWRTCFRNAYGGQTLVGMFDAWSTDSRPIKARLLVYDTEAVWNEATSEQGDEPIVYSSALLGGDGEFNLEVSSATNLEFAKYFTGVVNMEGYVNPHNNRWCVEMVYQTQCKEASSSDSNSPRYRIGVELVAEPGVAMDAYVDLVYSKFEYWPKYGKAQSYFSISDLCTGDNVISVGMFSSRRMVQLLDGSWSPLRFELMTIFNMSSYGTLRDGRVMPLTCAPGAPVISACNSHFLAKYPDQIPGMSAQANVNGKDYYWNVCVGTSMSSPYAAGVIATWLQADPTLKIDDVKKIVKETNYQSPTYDAHNGQGWLRPYDGLKYLLQTSGKVSDLSNCGAPSAVINGDIAEIYNPGGEQLRAEIYGLDGNRRLVAQVSEPVAQINLSGLGHGAYVLTLTRASQTPSRLKFVR